jgi:squalene cyclase
MITCFMNRNADDLIEAILKRQNKDGGWSYGLGAAHGSASWTEPTLYAALVLKASAADRAALARAMQWIGARQRQDGGFSPYESVEQSTWVTSLALLLSPEDFGSRCYQGALDWVLGQTSQESSWLYRLKLRWLSQDDSHRAGGWPWFPGTASWVSPTSTAILGLRRAQIYASHEDSRQQAITRRIEDGKRFLMSHTCQDGGWNHGSEKALGYAADSYPETTGAALLALRGAPRERLTASIDRAKTLAVACSFSEGLSWLRMGLAAHGETLPPKPVAAKARNLRDECLEVLSQRVDEGAVQL